MSGSAKAVDPAFQGAGSKPGLEIWRIENFQPVPLPKSDYGKFYSGDSYIVLHTSSGKGGAYLYDIHFWLGKDTSQDEAGTAAIKTVELDVTLGGKAVQHRELQGHESDKFLSYFKPCIIPLEGGVASGFKKPEEEEFETRLYLCHGKRAVKVKQVPFARSSLNHDDVFILDTKDKIYQFNGANSNIQERAKALEVVQFLKDQYHGGTCDVAIVDDGKLQAESDSGEFWVLFGGFAPIGRKVASEDDVIPEETPAKLYSITDGQVQRLEGELSKGMLENNECYLLDCGAEVFIWFGRVTQVEDRKSACQAAEEFVSSQNRPKSTRITRVIQGYETHSFKAHFDSWPAGSAAPTTEEGRGKVAAFLKQQGLGVKGTNKTAPVNEDVPPLLEAGGKIEMWRINGNAKTPVPKEDIGKFYSGDCYIILYTYHSGEKKEDYYLCWWIGKDSVEDDQKMAARLANTMCNSLKGRPVLGRIFQGKEPPQFIALFQPMVVLRGGLSSTYKKFVEEKGLADETYSSDGVALVQISGTSSHNSKGMQVDVVAGSLNSYDCFVLHSGSSIFVWHGGQSTHEQQQLAAKVAEFLKPGSTLKYAKEGTENSAFWSALGGKQDYTSKKSSQELVRDPHMFSFKFNKEGKFKVEEVYNFTQDDLLTEDMMILDTHIEVIVWVGQSVDPKEKQTAFEIGEKYVQMAASLEGRSQEIPLYRVTEGNEPSFFTTYFSWDPAKAIVQGNSFQKKVMLLLGASHATESLNRANGSNQGGPTQRASALAALSSAFKPASGEKSTSPTRSNGQNQGGATQRASALAALSSALNPSTERKSTAASRPVGTGQGSQRAAALAALSSALTAERKPQSPDASPVLSARSSSPPADHSPFAPKETENTPSEVAEESPAVPEVQETESVEAFVPESKAEESVSKDEPEQEETASGSTRSTFTYEQLRARSENPVTGIDFKRREAYLSDEEFQSIFGMNKEAFYKLPRWKQDMQKRKFDLF